MRVGSFVYATDQGLGILAKSFYDHGIVTDVMVVRHGRHTTHDEWYPNAKQITDLRNREQQVAMMVFAASMDVMLFFETPFYWPVIEACRQANVPTALMPMFECMPERIPYQPDLFINPSHLDQQYYPQGIHIPVPVEYPWRKRERAEVFVHNAGHGGLKGRNGTLELMQALRFIKSDAKIIIRAQDPRALDYTTEARIGQVEFVFKQVPYETLFAEGDVFVFPEKFNGLSLPLQEARAAGMLVMCGARFPMTEWLPGYVRFANISNDPILEQRDVQLLIPVKGYHRERIGPPYNEYDCAEFDPRDIAARIDEWYGQDISEYSLSGRAWVEAMSWNVLRPQYIQALETLCRKK